MEELEGRITPTFTLSVIATFPPAMNFGNGLASTICTNLVSDSNGDIFGGTAISNATSHSDTGEYTLFELAKGSTTLTTLATFTEDDPGDFLNCVAIDGSGNIFGTIRARASTTRAATAP